MIRNTLPIAIVGALLLVSCGESSSGSNEDAFDPSRACRIGQRLVDETADGDRDGVVKQIERLAELDGIGESGLDVDDLDAIAEDLDQNAVEDLIAEFDLLDCDLTAPEATPVETDPPATDPPSTDTPVDTVATTDPPATDPPASDPPTSDAPPATNATPPVATDTGVAVDVGSTGPGAAIGLDRPTEAIISEFDMEGILYSPNTNVVELTIDRSDTSFGGEPEWSRRDTITMSATTAQTLEDIRNAYKAAIESSGIAYDFTESTSSSDDSRSVGLSASASEFDLSITRWDIDIAESDDLPGVVLIEVNRSDYFDGTIPPIPEPAQELLQPTATIGVDLGWTLSTYRLSEAINSFSGGTYTFGSLRWDISEDDTLVASADALKAALGGGPFDSEEADADRISWFLPTDDSPLFSVNYSEFGGTSASYTT